MGPFSEERQYQRAASICRLLEQPLPDETRAMWEGHLRNLARNETQYNYRVVEVYKNIQRRGVIQWAE